MKCLNKSYDAVPYILDTKANNPQWIVYVTTVPRVCSLPFYTY